MNAAIFFQLIAGLALLAAGLLQVAVIRAPDVPNGPEAKLAVRKVMCGAMLIGGGYLLNTAFAGSQVDKVMALSLGLIGVSQSVFSLIKLFPEEYHHGRK